MWNLQPKHPKRKRYRLPDCDYRKPNRFFVTICTQNRRRLFGYIRNGIMRLNDAGRIADAHWKSLSDHFPHIRLDKHVVMPDHIHGIVDIVDFPDDITGPQHAAAGNDHQSGNQKPPPHVGTEPKPQHRDDRHGSQHAATLRMTAGSLGVMIRSYKSAVTADINRLRNTPGSRVWQYRFHERIIRTESAHERIRRYIENNPARWSYDHPDG